MTTGQTNRVFRHLYQIALLRDGGGMSDGQLLDSFLVRRDDVAFEALVKRHGRMVFAVCRRILRNQDDKANLLVAYPPGKGTALAGMYALSTRSTVSTWAHKRSCW